MYDEAHGCCRPEHGRALLVPELPLPDGRFGTVGLAAQNVPCGP